VPELIARLPSNIVEKRVRVVVSGDVQGVGFRWTCRQVASAAGVAGFVRNLPDGRVEAVFEGSADGVNAMVEWCRRGPRWASVTSVDIREESPLGASSFEISH
jgi:acylphosphatase